MKVAQTISHAEGSKGADGDRLEIWRCGYSSWTSRWPCDPSTLRLRVLKCTVATVTLSCSGEWCRLCLPITTHLTVVTLCHHMHSCLALCTCSLHTCRVVPTNTQTSTQTPKPLTPLAYRCEATPPCSARNGAL